MTSPHRTPTNGEMPSADLLARQVSQGFTRANHSGSCLLLSLVRSPGFPGAKRWLHLQRRSGVYVRYQTHMKNKTQQNPNATQTVPAPVIPAPVAPAPAVVPAPITSAEFLTEQKAKASKAYALADEGCKSLNGIKDEQAFRLALITVLSSLNAVKPLKLDGEDGRPAFSPVKATRKEQMTAWKACETTVRSAIGKVIRYVTDAGQGDLATRYGFQVSPNGIVTLRETNSRKLAPVSNRGERFGF